MIIAMVVKEDMLRTSVLYCGLFWDAFLGCLFAMPFWDAYLGCLFGMPFCDAYLRRLFAMPFEHR